MKALAWILIGLAVLILFGMLALTIDWWEFWGYPEDLGEAFGSIWPIFVYPAVPGLVGYLLLRSVRSKERQPSERT